MRHTKASMRAHHLRVGQMSVVEMTSALVDEGPGRRFAYSSERYHVGFGHGASPFLSALSELSEAMTKQSGASPGKHPGTFLSKAWGFL